MSRLRWNTVDRRGEHWARARRRRLTALGATAAAGLVLLASIAGTSSAETPSDLHELQRAKEAELAAVERAHEARVAELERAAAGRIAVLVVARDGDLAALETSTRTEVARLAQLRQGAVAGADARRSAARGALGAQLTSERATIDAFFTDVLTRLGPTTATPSKAALEAAKKSLEARRASELGALDATHTAAELALDGQVKASVGALEAELRRAAERYDATRAALAAALTRQLEAIAGTRAAALGAIDADTTTIKARHASERATLDQLHAAQRQAAASSPAAARAALDDRQHAERDELIALQRGELEAQEAAKRAADAEASEAESAAKAAKAADEADAKVQHDSSKAALETALAREKADGAARLKALQAEHSGSYDGLKATFDAAVASVAKGHAAVRSGWAARLARHEGDAVQRGAALDARFAVERGRIEGEERNAVEAVARKLRQDQRARTRRHDGDVATEQRALKARIGAAARDRARQQRLVESRYFSLRVRAVAFNEHPGAFPSVERAYDPATDPGSLWNVARRIGAAELPEGVTGAGVDVAIIDTGVVDVPGLAEADVQVGPDFSFEDAIPELRALDTNGHGTHLGAIIAGRDEAWNAGDHGRRADRFLGIAPGARLISVKAGTADGSVDVSQVIAAINWVVANQRTGGRNIRVLNLAFGTDGVQDYRLDPLAHAVERAWHAGILVVVAAGNDGWQATRLTNPAQDPFVLAVAASQSVDAKESMPAEYSNGTTEERVADLAAPGRSIVSLRNPGSFSDAGNEEGRTGERFVRGSGTSQAAAVTSGAVALLLSQRPELTPDQVKHLLMSTAESAGTDGALVGGGYLRVDRAVKAKATTSTQAWERSTGGGSLDGARGTVRVARDGIVLEGEVDIFGRSWTDSAWAADEWTRRSWTGTGWSGAGWSADMWSGRSWTGGEWTRRSWTGATWTRRSWTADGWSGRSWTASSWSAGGWFGMGWGDGPAPDVVVGAEPVTAPAADAAGA